MLHTWLPCFALLLAAAQDAPLELASPRATYGYLGAARPKEGILPGDAAYFTFDIKNLKLDADGKASYSIAIEIRDAQGKVFYEQKPYNSVAQNFLGGNSLPCSAHVEIPLDARPGAVSWKVTVKDRTTNQTASVTGQGKILPLNFGIVQVALFADAEAKTPRAAVGVVGESAYLLFAIVGFGQDKAKKNPNVHVSMRILDEDGKSTMVKPLTGSITSNLAPDGGFLPMQFGLTLNRAGRYAIELSAEDRVTGKTAQIRYGVRVLALE